MIGRSLAPGRRRRPLLEPMESRELLAGGLTATYFDGLDLTRPLVSRVEAAVDFTWGMGAPGASLNPDRFSARWAGSIEVPATANYTFHVDADDGVRLWVDGRLLIDNWTPHPPTEDRGTIPLAAGRRYDIVLEYFEIGGWATCKLSWSRAGSPKQVVPSQYLTPEIDAGLRATYFRDTIPSRPLASRIDPTVDFAWGRGAPDAGLNPDQFSARWTGSIAVPASRDYTFSTYSDDGVRLWVDGRLLIDNWTPHPPTEDRGTISLDAGRRHDIVLEYFEAGGGATCKLSWSSPGLPKQVVPTSALSPRPAVAFDAPTTPPTSGPPGDASWRLAFQENFDRIDPNVWSNRYWWNGDRGTEAAFDPSAASVSNGVLALTARRETRTTVDGVSQPYTSGLITTGGIDGVKAPGFTFTYGYVETRSKIAPGYGMWSAFWMLPASRNDGMAEIDIFENLGRQPDVFNAFFHRAARGVVFENKTPTGVDLTADWHVYGLDWQPGYLAWYFDGVEVGRYSVASEVPAEAMYLILNLDVGGAWAGPVGPSTPSQSSWLVDYIKVWQR